MKRQWLALTTVFLSCTAMMVALVCLGAGMGSQPARAAAQADPTLDSVAPSSAPNDLDTPIVVTGTNFEDGADVLLDGTSLEDVGWVSGTRLEAIVPWGIAPGVYDLTVVNPGGESDDLPNVFTVTQGIDVWNAGKLYGGEVGEIAINPDSPMTLYAGSESVGLFRSRDGGENWSFVYAPSARRIALDPITPTTLYWGDRLHRSDDEAETWLPLDVPGMVAYPHPTISGTVYFSHRWSDQAGLWKSEHFGEHWVTATANLTDTYVSFLAFHPTDPMTMVVGTTHGNIFVSGDGGDSWTFASKPVEMVNALAFSPFAPYELWVSDGCFCVPEYTYKSTNLNYTEWITVLSTALDSIAFPSRLGWGDAYSRTVYAASCFAAAYKTTDAGGTWENWGPGEAAGWGGIALDPKTPGAIYKASLRDGVYKTTDGGDTWRVVNQGLTAMAPHQLAPDPHQPDVVYATVNGWKGVFQGTRGGESWQFWACEGVSYGPTMLVDPFTPGRLYLAGHEEIFRSDDGGQTWPISGTLDPPDVCTVNVQTLSPHVLRADPEQSGTLLAGSQVICNDFAVWAGAIYRSTDHGEHWTLIDAAQEISAVIDLAYDAQTTTIVYAATDGTGMLRSTDGGQKWHPMDEGNPALDSVRSIAVEPVAPYRVFAQAEYPYGGLYVSENHGLTWTLTTSWLWSEQLLCTDEDSSMLYAATADGLLRSDGGQSWSSAAGVLGQVPVYSLATVRDGERVILYAGTTGGYVEGGASGAVSQVNAEGTLVNAGVYRYTTLRRWWVYLPLVVHLQ
jgi:photosystem II stability/assembly factor-like uncharacterized protein